jgi:hypothetical protein
MPESWEALNKCQTPLVVFPAQAGIQSKQWSTECRVKPGKTGWILLQRFPKSDPETSTHAKNISGRHGWCGAGRYRLD